MIPIFAGSKERGSGERMSGNLKPTPPFLP